MGKKGKKHLRHEDYIKIARRSTVLSAIEHSGAGRHKDNRKRLLEEILEQEMEQEQEEDWDINHEEDY